MGGKIFRQCVVLFRDVMNHEKMASAKKVICRYFLLFQYLSSVDYILPVFNRLFYAYIVSIKKLIKSLNNFKEFYMNKLQEIEVRHLEIKMSSRMLEHNNKIVHIPPFQIASGVVDLFGSKIFRNAPNVTF